MTRGMAFMATAGGVAVLIMMSFAGPVSRFTNHDPSMKILVSGFPLMIGMTLIGEGLSLDIPRDGFLAVGGNTDPA